MSLIYENQIKQKKPPNIQTKTKTNKHPPTPQTKPLKQTGKYKSLQESHKYLQG